MREAWYHNNWIAAVITVGVVLWLLILLDYVLIKLDAWLEKEDE